MFSKTCEYGVRAIIYICANGTREYKIGISDISNNIEAPSHFTAKILQTLGHNDLVSSQKGVNGGFYMSKEQTQKKLIDVVRAIDGDSLFSGCGLGLKHCSEEEPCPLHDRFKSIRGNLKKMMEQTTINDMAEMLKKGRGFLRAEDLIQHEKK